MRNTTTYTKVIASLLHTGLYFQNVPNQSRVEQLASSFDWNKFDALTVSFRDGKYNVIDGQHRLLAAKAKFGNKIQVPCHIRLNLTEEEEMELFISLVNDKRRVHSNELYKAMYGAGRKSVVQMVDTIKEVGFCCDFRTNQSNGRIRNIHSVFSKIFTQTGIDDFKLYLELLMDTWNGDKKSLENIVMLSVFDFFATYRFEYDHKNFAKKLSQTTPMQLISELKSTKTDVGRREVILNKYNKSLKGSNRLELR